MIIRKKEQMDCKEWVEINIEGWNTLKGIVSKRVLKIINDNKDKRIENDIKNFETNDLNYVLEDSNNVIGILKIKKSERINFEEYGEVQVLYLKTNQKGKGYGKMLVNKAFEILKEKGFKKVVIGCIDKNPSNEFYKHIGGTFIRQEPFIIFDEKYIENIYEYEL